LRSDGARGIKNAGPNRVPNDHGQPEPNAEHAQQMTVTLHLLSLLIL
jgi:hypothetical protein